jgi:hypothetical protein
VSISLHEIIFLFNKLLATYQKLTVTLTIRIRQYRLRISQWDRDKNVKPSEMKGIIRKRQRRNLVEVEKKPLEFSVRGRKVEDQKIDRFMKRYGIPQSLLYSPKSIAGESH